MLMMQQVTRLFNTAHFLHAGLQDHSLEVVQTPSKGGCKIVTAMPTACASVLGDADSVLEDIVSLILGRFQSMANLDKSFTLCEIAVDGATISYPNSSTHFQETSTHERDLLGQDHK